MQLGSYLQLKSRTRFRLRLEFTVIVLGLLVSQVLLLKFPMVDMLLSVLAVLYVSELNKEYKTRREPFNRKQKLILLSLTASLYCGITAVFLVAGIITRKPICWIAFGLSAVLSLVVLIHEYDQIFKDGETS